ncbi:hypothetical protein [Synechococcus sp. UW105]|jgi:hypothetical protein|uniref:hypothetical protein n=1 Tax=unclassified Synechococcus TaxID=2626047 RepID=UPI0010BDAA15|nr:hypothetical protein [Synechococcus sp. UW105]RZO10039.1 MAG: hypothetical protein EVB08_10465 [Synechococcus sp. MED-G135]|tara:strand:- start:130 stop:510 length:381 start_codon:yes stop_codon:yes gene_type:complete
MTVLGSIGMEARCYCVRFEADGADLFVELHAQDTLNRQHVLERVVAILEDRHGIAVSQNELGAMTRVVHSDGSTLLAWLSISGNSIRQSLDDEGLDEILTCLAFLAFPPVVETSAISADGKITPLN